MARLFRHHPKPFARFYFYLFSNTYILQVPYPVDMPITASSGKTGKVVPVAQASPGVVQMIC
jgi:hypothetical protein